jgi:DNA-binding NarL/FixJ family response regulator
MKILIVDDHPIVRDALRAVVGELDANIVLLEAKDGSTALLLAEQNPDLDLLLLDLWLPDQHSEFDTLAALRERHVSIPVVVLSQWCDKKTVQRAIDMGAMGFIPKSTDREKLVPALKLVLGGVVYVPPEIFGRGDAPGIPALHPSPDGDDALEAFNLTPRELEVLALVVQGKPDKAIANRFDIGLQTVKNHVGRILEKTDSQNRTELVFKLAQLHVRLDHIAEPSDKPPVPCASPR